MTRHPVGPEASEAKVGADPITDAVDWRGRMLDLATLEAVPLNELPRYSPWPARLLGAAPFEPKTRTVDLVRREYGDDKFQRTLDRFERQQRQPSSIDLRVWLQGENDGRPRCAVIDDRLVLATTRELYAHQFAMFAAWMGEAIGSSRTVVELGCAFGTYLWVLSRHFPDKTFVGGELTDSARTLAAAMYGDDGPAVERFDFYDENYALLERLEPPITIFTSQALEQIPSCRDIVARIAALGDRVERVFHLEPCYERQSDDLLGLMRRRYLELNDYNRDLVSALESNASIELRVIRLNAFAFNPLNALSWYEWRPCRGGAA